MKETKHATEGKGGCGVRAEGGSWGGGVVQVGGSGKGGRVAGGGVGFEAVRKSNVGVSNAKAREMAVTLCVWGGGWNIHELALGRGGVVDRSIACGRDFEGVGWYKV